MTDYASIEPFEICSIRPPTENTSLTFRLSRNCHWNKCGFCPVYKLGAKFSRRDLGEVKADIERAKRIDDLLFEEGIAAGISWGSDYARAAQLIGRIKAAGGAKADGTDERFSRIGDREDLDDRMRWFLSWFKDAPAIEDSVYHLVQWRAGGGQTCFLGDADSLILKPDFLCASIDHVKRNFPSIARFTIYGRTRTAARQRTLSELKAFAKAGLNRVHFGLESGCDEVLALVNKGVTAEEHVEGCLKVREAGLSCSVYVMPGLGGAALSEKNAADTAAVLTRIRPDFVRIRSLELFPMTPLEKMSREGLFAEASEEMVVREIRTLVMNTECETEIMSDSASNLLPVHGKLPCDRARMLDMIDAYLGLSPRRKLEHSLRARLGSFIGQYGDITDDIAAAIAPMISGGSLNFSGVSDSEIESATRLIRSKLMP